MSKAFRDPWGNFISKQQLDFFHRDEQSKVIPYTVIDIGGPDKIEAFRLARKAYEAKWKEENQKVQAIRREKVIESLCSESFSYEQAMAHLDTLLNVYDGPINEPKREKIRSQQRELAQRHAESLLAAIPVKLSWFDKVKKFIKF